MTRKEIREFGQHMADKLFHKKEQDNIIIVKGWIARDSTDKLYFYDKKPFKGKCEWLADANIMRHLDSNYFPQVNWEDDKPVACEIVIKIEK